MDIPPSVAGLFHSRMQVSTQADKIRAKVVTSTSRV